MARPFSSALSVAEAFVVREAGFDADRAGDGQLLLPGGLAVDAVGAARVDGVAARGRHVRARDPDRGVERGALARPQPPARRGGRRAGPTRSSACACSAAATTGPPGWSSSSPSAPRCAPSATSSRTRPSLSHLSGQDFAKLVRHGFWPVGLVGGLDGRLRRRRLRPAGTLVGALLRAPEPGAARLHARHLRRSRSGHGRASPARRTRCTPTASSASRSSAHASDARPRRRRHDLPRPDHRDARARHRRSSRCATTRRRRRQCLALPLRPGSAHERRARALRPHLDWPACPSTGASAWSGCASARCFTSDLSVNEFLLVKRRGLRAARARRRHLDLPHRLPDGGVEPQPGDGRPDPGDVPRPRARDDAHGGGGRPARRRRDRRRAPRRQPPRLGQRPRRVRRHRHRRAPPRGRAAPRAQRPARSRATSRARTSTRCSRPATGRSGMVMGTCVYHVAHQGLRHVDAPRRAQRRDAELHPGALRRARAGDGAHAGRGRGARGRGRRRRRSSSRATTAGARTSSSTSRSAPR